MRKHFVVFCSPGTFVAEQTEKPIKSWDVDAAVRMAKKIKERHNALPYGFYFTTRERKRKDLDSKEIKHSAMYYLGGEVLTLDDVKKRKDPKDKMLISNMWCNKWDRIVVNTNSYKWTQPLEKGDVVLDVDIKKTSKNKCQ